MRKAKSWFRSEAKWTAVLLCGVPALGLLGTLALLLIRLLRAGG
jgi:hypothetical protein